VITEQPLDVADLLRVAPDPGNGAVVTFLGVVRAENGGRKVTRIRYDAYAAMAEREISSIVDAAQSGTRVSWARIVHRVGDVAPGEASLFVAVAAPHRAAAFDACQFIVTEIKLRVPIWKKEHYADGTAAWI